MIEPYSKLFLDVVTLVLAWLTRPCGRARVEAGECGSHDLNVGLIGVTNQRE